MDQLKGHSNPKVVLHVKHKDDVAENRSGSLGSRGRNNSAMDKSGSFSPKLKSVVWKSTISLSENAGSLRPILSGEEIRLRSSTFGNRQDVLKSKATTSNAEEWPCSFENVTYSTQSPMPVRKAPHGPENLQSDYEHVRAKHMTRSLSADRAMESPGTPPPRSNGCPVTTVRALREELNNRRPKSFIQLKTSSTTTSEDRLRRTITGQVDINERQNEERIHVGKDLEKCRYLRERNLKELSVEDIFR
ncbi:hypothetical protein ACJMK2_002181 [Sinanodonta woodiana]|uniref:Uncharacterized protein n=1 Tax=Sinanodonta woodiana TaxID=1069815 RepID=A0ABD3XUG4_SINWO